MPRMTSVTIIFVTWKHL